jgi:hypothetical protein
MSYSSSALSFAKLLIRTEFPIDKNEVWGTALGV